MTGKTILESKGVMHIDHLRIFTVTDIACRGRRPGRHQESKNDNYYMYVKSHNEIIKYVFGNFI